MKADAALVNKPIEQVALRDLERLNTLLYECAGLARTAGQAQTAAQLEEIRAPIMKRVVSMPASSI